MSNVVITDSRPKWMIKEDRHMACMMHCRLYKCCNSRVGNECKKLGGDTIPKIRRD